MSIPSSFQFKGPTQRHVVFGGILRASPTVAIDHYRTLYATRASSSSAEADLMAATELLGSTLTYKDWEAHLSGDQRVISRSDLVHGFTAGVKSISTDIWDAIVGTKLPLFWLDAAIQHNPVHDLVVQKMFQCLITFTYIWSQELSKEPQERRDRISSSFASLYFTKFNNLCTILWQSREYLAKHMIFDMLGRLAHDLTQVHTQYGLPKRQLEHGKIAHLTLWALCNRNTLTLEGTASPRDLEGFNVVSEAVSASLRPQEHSAWLRAIVKIIGPEKIMNVLSSVAFHPSKADRTAGDFACAIKTMLFHVDECLYIVYCNPVKFMQDCSCALNQQIQCNLRMFPVPARWAQNMGMWENMYRLCLLPYDGFVRGPYRTRASAIGQELLNLQARGVTTMLEIWDQKAAYADLDPNDTARGISIIDERLVQVYMSTVAWTGAVQSGVLDDDPSARAWHAAYKEGARAGWLQTAKLLREARSKYGLETSFGRLVQYWFEIGKCIGLREADGLLQLDRTCSSPSCQYHLVPAQNPLSKCKGCQEARYCSRECQVSDWKARHRVLCRRLQAAPS